MLLQASIIFFASFESVGNVVLFSATVVSDSCTFYWACFPNNFTDYANIFSTPFSPIRFLKCTKSLGSVGNLCSKCAIPQKYCM